MSINLTDEIEVKTKKGKLSAAKQIFLEGDMQNVEKEIQDINSRHSALNTKHESLSKTVQGIVATGGASTANNVTYNNNSSRLNAENAQDAIDELENKKIDKSSIVQTTGEAEDKVMSQQATTDELNKKLDKSSIVQESGDSEELVMSQKAVSNKLNDLSSTISEINDKADNASSEVRNALKKAEAANKTAEENKETLTNATSDISTLKKKVEDIPATITKFVNMKEEAYEALETKDPDTYYMLTEE